ncbi:transcriptional regulator GcvA [Oceanibacterium hippocampi]|uniref:Glycine cleavage system transcriptional activator n=1 Tax=Oceanibacterium hippocampi TaxID=745714 RepID=A0A1Y5R8B2_9PROT|nr:transcriptional regulator GcvA [Oceanibacterium hippocampi]SLN11458.1 Glycine cleavage system transcriptional activator [Oceanibacterium hippocampi]
MLNRLPSLNGLRTFECVARHMSFTAAARELNVTQTAVSHQIRRLEAELGLRLFDRGGRSLQLTAEGNLYLPAVRAAFDGLRHATARLGQDMRPNTLTVSTLTSLAAKWLVPKLGGFQAIAPDIDVRVTTSLALVDFGRDEVDVAIRYGHGDWPGLRADLLMNDEVLPVCSPALLAGPIPLDRPADLERHTLIHTSTAPDDWQLWLTAVGLDFPPSHRITTDLALSAIQAAIDGVGVAIARRRFVEDDLVAGRLVEPFDVNLPVEAGYYVVAPAETADREKIRRFRDWLMTVAAATPIAAVAGA